MKYPKEAPVFRLTVEWNSYWPKGTDIELTELDNDAIMGCAVWNLSAGHFGYVSIGNVIRESLPLTQSARAMLAIARGTR